MIRDIRYTLRQLRNAPGFTIVAILMLAVGIGATTSIFSVVEGVLLRPLPSADPNRLMVVGDLIEAANCGFCGRSSTTAAGVQNYMRDTHGFTHLGGYRGTSFELNIGGEL